MSGDECDADKNLGKNALHEGTSKSNECPTGRRQRRGYLRSRKNTSNGPPHGRTGSLDERPGGREFGRRRPIHPGQRFCQEFLRDDCLNNGLIRIRNPDRKFFKKPINRIITDENKVPIFLDRKVKLQPGQAVVEIFRMRNLNSLSDSQQVYLVPNPNSQFGDFMPELLGNAKRNVCQCVIEHTGHHGFNPAWKEAWLRCEDRL